MKDFAKNGALMILSYSTIGFLLGYFIKDIIKIKK